MLGETGLAKAQAPRPDASACPDAEALVQFFAASANDGSNEALKSHVDSCDSCLRVFAALASEHFASLPQHDLAEEQKNELLVAGESVGRFVVLHPVGMGGMGHVYAAYDPELDRRVALKLMQQAGSAANASLLREARLIAKLEHPNVVTLYDVGSHGDAVYLAMEFVDGPGLLEYFRDRPLPEVLAYFDQVAAGLEAAHQQGILHRDVKPANLLVGADDRARIADFGLAGAEAATGRVGTPAYMAPEQAKGAATAKSDQFSFCVSLLQATTGALHKSGDPLPKETPEKIRTVLTKGLQQAPEDRYADMQSLRRALVPAPPRRVWMAIPVVLLVAGLASALWFQQPSAHVPCTDSERHIASLWNDDVATALERRFRELSGFGPALWERTRPALEQYRDNWIAQHRSTCEATSVHKDQTAAQMDKAMQCLATRRAEFAGLLSALDAAPLENIHKAADAQALLIAPSACGDQADAIPIPEDAATREAIATLRPKLAEWNARAAMGELDPAATGLGPLRKQANALGYLPLQAEVSSMVASVFAKLGKHDDAELAFRDAIRFGTESRHDLLVAKAWLDLSWLHGYHQDRYDEAKRDLENGQAFSKRLGQPGVLPMLYERNSGWFALRQGKPVDALRHYEEALALATGQPNEARDVAMLHSDLGSAYLTNGNIEKAAEHIALGLRSMSALLGPLHPDTLSVHVNYSIVLREQGKIAEAIAESIAALEGFRTSMQSSDSYEGMILNNLATMYSDQEDWTLAEKTYREAIAVNKTGFAGKANTTLAAAIHGLATVVQLDDERHAEAEALHQESLAMKEALVGKDHPSVAISLSGIADFYVATKRRPEAIAAAERGLAILMAAYGAEHPHTVYLREQLAEIRTN